MHPQEYLDQLNTHLSYLYSFARQINELDFAASLSGEFRGMQDAGWATTITAHEVFHELIEFLEKGQQLTRAEYRVILMLYCQLAEAGGAYETLKNLMGTVVLKPYLLWPFKDLVTVKTEPSRVIGPNANATFRNLALTAKQIGLSGLSSLLELAFRDDIRNGISHADYIIWDDGLRLRKRNGGNPYKLTFDDVSTAVLRALHFFDLFRNYNQLSVQSFNPAKEIVGRLSENFPMPWTIFCDPKTGAFSISGSSPGAVTTPEYERQFEINSRLGGKVLAVYTSEQSAFTETIGKHISAAGFEPNSIMLNREQFTTLKSDIDSLRLWDERHSGSVESPILMASPWGFRSLLSEADFDGSLPKPLLDIDSLS